MLFWVCARPRSLWEQVLSPLKSRKDKKKEFLRQPTENNLSKIHDIELWPTRAPNHRAYLESNSISILTAQSIELSASDKVAVYGRGTACDTSRGSRDTHSPACPSGRESTACRSHRLSHWKEKMLLFTNSRLQSALTHLGKCFAMKVWSL